MPRWLALDWDRREVRYALVATARSSVQVLSAGAVSIGGQGGDASGPAQQASLNTALREAVEQAGGAKVPALVCLGRSAVELIASSVPPAADAELPEMVRNLTLRESSLASEATVVDFVVDGSDTSQQRKVEAIAISQSRLEAIVEHCRQARAVPRHVLLRPYATAALAADWARSSQASLGDSALLWVSVLGDEADLGVQCGDRLVLWRTVRLAGDVGDDATASRLMDEIRRTLLVATERLNGGEVSSVCLFGAADDAESQTATSGIAARIRDQIKLPCEEVNPFLGSPAVTADRSLLPAAAGSFAALVGAVVEHARDDRGAIDLLNPRQAPKPPNRLPMAVIAGALAALLLGFGGYRLWGTISALDRENAALADRLADLDKQVKQAATRVQTVGAIREWDASGVIWLDELRDLSVRFPTARDAIVMRMSLARARTGGGTIDFEGLVRAPSIVGRIERQLRDDQHEVRSKRVQKRTQEDDSFAWQFESSMSVTRPGAAADENAIDAKRPGTTTAGKKAVPAKDTKDAKAPSTAESSAGGKSP